MARTRLAASIAALVALAPRASRPEGVEGPWFKFAPFGAVHVFAPEGPPTGVVLFLSGDGGWDQRAVTMAKSFRRLGALVAGLNSSVLTRNLEASGLPCAYPAGNLEELSRDIQLRLGLPAYRRPLLVGYSSGATLVYGVLAQAPAETFAGGISIGFCADTDLDKPLCAGRALVSRKRPTGHGADLEPASALGVPWVVLHGDADRLCALADTRRFVGQVGGARLLVVPEVGHGFAAARRWEGEIADAYRELTAERPEPSPQAAPEVGDLPLVEELATAGPSRDVLAVLLSGDGGWASLDKGLAAAFAGQGIPVVGWNSLRYYWNPRTPDTAAADLQKLLRHYLAAWGKRRAILIGYSFGADVLPFLAARLPGDLRSRVAGIGLLGLSRRASFEFHVVGWLGGEGDARFPTLPEIGRLRGLRVACVYGEGDPASACHALPAGVGQAVTLPGGHHFGGDYPRIAATLIKALDVGEAPPDHN